MKITKLEKKKRLYLLELDHKESSYITEDTIVRFFLSKDKTITPEEYQAIKEFAQHSYGKNLALYHLSFKKRSKQEVKNYLQKYNLEESSIQLILTELEKDNWINDTQYTQSYIEQNLAIAGKGPLLIQQKLLQKGIPLSIIKENLEQVDFSENIQLQAQKIFRKYEKKLPKRALQDKIIQQLLTKGHSYSISKKTVETLNITNDSEQEDNLIAKEYQKQYQKLSKKYDGYELKQRLIQALSRKGFDFDHIKTYLREYL